MSVESQAERLADRRNVVGQLRASVAGYDRHDLKELAPFSSPYLALVFPHSDWDEHAADFTSDYHYINDGPDQWSFDVRSDHPGREITLYWTPIQLLQGIWTQDNGKRTWSKEKQKDGMALYKRMVLEDLDLNVIIPAVEDDGTVNHYVSNMNGQLERHFRWVFKSKNGKGPKAKTKQHKTTATDTSGFDPNADPMQEPPKPGKRIGQQ